ncbi:MAG: GyrI-like domain-containing protein [Methylophilaceae bacterium]|nr:GyrI-like domain-containing protein [Methylophilaceae bacterium]
MKKPWISFLVAFALPILGVLTWWGLFSSAKIEVTERGPYRYAYLEAEGPYSKLGSKRGEVDKQLREQGVEPGSAIAIIFNDPRSTERDKRRARTGFIIDDGVIPKEPLKTTILPKRKVVSASIKAHPVFAYGKAYGGLLDFTKQHDMTLHLPTVELYDASVLTVEMPLETSP